MKSKSPRVCIAEFDNVLSIIDFKSANKEKSPEILENHILQETAYAIMWNELTDIPIQQIVTIVACENGELRFRIDHARQLSAVKFRRPVIPIHSVFTKPSQE